MQADIEITNGKAIITLPVIHGLNGFELIFQNVTHTPQPQKQGEQKKQGVKAEKKKSNDIPNETYVNSMIGVYTSYISGDMYFLKGVKAKIEDALMPVFIATARKTDHMATFEKMPFFIKSIFGGLVAVMRVINEKRSDDFIADCKRGWRSSSSDPLVAFRGFLMKHGEGRSVKDNAGRALFGQACMIVMDAWWHKEKLLLKDLENQMRDVPQPMRFAPIAVFQTGSGTSKTLMDIVKKNTA